MRLNGQSHFLRSHLLKELEADALRPDGTHDFGHDILPSMLGRAAMYAYDYRANAIPGESADVPAYWRDVGTLEAPITRHKGICVGRTFPESV